MPNFPLDEIEDYYTYYVQIMKINEELFWNADFPFLKRIVENKSAYDAWFSGVLQDRKE